MKEFEKQKKTDEEELLEIATAEEKKKLERFISTEKDLVTKPKTGINLNLPGTSSGSGAISNMSNGKEKQLPSFWAPSQTPDAKRSKMDKPDGTIYCPITEKPIKAKDLIDVKFTQIPDDGDNKSLIAKEIRYKCPITHDALSNSIPCAVIRTT